MISLNSPKCAISKSSFPSFITHPSQYSRLCYNHFLHVLFPDWSTLCFIGHIYSNCCLVKFSLQSYWYVSITNRFSFNHLQINFHTCIFKIFILKLLYPNILMHSTPYLDPDLGLDPFLKLMPNLDSRYNTKVPCRDWIQIHHGFSSHLTCLHLLLCLRIGIKWNALQGQHMGPIRFHTRRLRTTWACNIWNFNSFFRLYFFLFLSIFGY